MYDNKSQNQLWRHLNNCRLKEDPFQSVQWRLRIGKISSEPTSR